MYWLLSSTKQQSVRSDIERLVLALADCDNGASQEDQLFPFVGRKDRKKSAEIVKSLTKAQETVCDPFSGSGILAYAIAQENRILKANEYEIYTNRMSNAPWRMPDEAQLDAAYSTLCTAIAPILNELYKTTCVCGSPHVFDSLFFDRDPLEYQNIRTHERLGKKGENITYRGVYKCPSCGATEKHFDALDLAHINNIASRPASQRFNQKLIENSRINLNSAFTTYGNLFPHRSKLALEEICGAIDQLKVTTDITEFLQDVFLSILPQAKYKDYRSKSQDLHCPSFQLREVNLLYRFQQQYQKRLEGLKRYSFSTKTTEALPISCADFRDYLATLKADSIDLILTDPPWADGNAYFEKAQLYHPWLSYSLMNDPIRLAKEVVITDAPSRRQAHSEEKWWQDINEMFASFERVLNTEKYLALMFRPIRASEWLFVLNKIKFISRAHGFEPLLTVDLKSEDPSMRIQQSASYAFVDDLVMVFIKLPKALRRVVINEQDIDQYTYQIAEQLQEEVSGPFSYKQWREKISPVFVEKGLHNLNLTQHEPMLLELFKRYCDKVEAGKFLPKYSTPFSGQLFDLPAVERFFTYVPKVISELSVGRDRFTYSEFVLKLSQFLENGSRKLIQEINDVDVKALLAPYAEEVEGTKYFKLRQLPALPTGLTKVMDLDPYGFESFVAHLLKAQGFTQVVLAGRAGDRGVDVMGLDPQGKRTIVQCKQWASNNVGSTPIQRLDSFARTRKAERKILITTSDFTPQGLDEAKLTGTETINHEQLKKLISQYMPAYA